MRNCDFSEGLFIKMENKDFLFNEKYRDKIGKMRKTQIHCFPQHCKSDSVAIVSSHLIFVESGNIWIRCICSIVKCEIQMIGIYILLTVNGKVGNHMDRF
jgi:hypothetical protein